jgi:hypothetical protein
MKAAATQPVDRCLLSSVQGKRATVVLRFPEGYRWFKAQPDRLVTAYGVDGFKFDGGDAEYYLKTMLSKPRSFKPGVTPNEHCEVSKHFGTCYRLQPLRSRN